MLTWQVTQPRIALWKQENILNYGVLWTENTNMESHGETPIEEIPDSRIIIDIENDHFSLMHTNNLDVVQVYSVLLAALEYLDSMLDTTEKSIH